ncbi:MAG: DUF4178 domain-containing protein [Stenomitos rutilans HA7619-LM2]|jgi:hypothetical protein|nr:DUF4178 domain-containing protein [Stenomitos rutilans HA7619-LM2]
MTAGLSETQLRDLREGSQLKYHGVQWVVQDYSTYTDANSYETEEWLLKSSTSKAYYLLREVDPQNPETLVHWYLAEELRYPTLLDPKTSRDRLTTVGNDMRSHATPYPELQLFNRVYAFESQTEGDYESDGTLGHRITWDYWDSAHLWNLALEAWSDGTLAVYSTRVVQPTDFTEIQSGDRQAFLSGQNAERSVDLAAYAAFKKRDARSREILIAWIVTIVGFFLMLSGI